MGESRIPEDFKYKEAFLAGRPSHEDDAFSRKHPKMPREKRAKIFAPFDALDGYSESISEKNVEYVPRPELGESDREELDRRLQAVRRLVPDRRTAREHPVRVRIRYFIPNAGGGRLDWEEKGLIGTVTGTCLEIDPVVRQAVIISAASADPDPAVTDLQETVIPIRDIVQIEAEAL